MPARAGSRRSSTCAVTTPAFCRDCFIRHCGEQVRRAIDDHDMIAPGRPRARRGVGRQGLARALAAPARARLRRRRPVRRPRDRRVLRRIGRATRAAFAARARVAAHRGRPRARRTASTSRRRRRRSGARRARPCGLSKRHVFNDAALANGYDVLATGHNLDDEAAVLLGNVLRWDAGYLGRQHPVLPAAPGFVRKVKPLVRLGEREIGGVLRARRHRLHRRGVPDGGGQPPPRLQGAAQRDRGAVAGHEGRVPVRLPRAGRTSASPATRSRSAKTCTRARSAARRPRPTSARSAGCGAPRGDAPDAPVAGRDRAADGPCFAAGDQVLLVDHKKRRHLVTLEVGGPVPHARGDRRARRPDRPPRRHHRAHARAAPASSRCGRRWPSTCWRCRAARR